MVRKDLKKKQQEFRNEYTAKGAKQQFSVPSGEVFDRGNGVIAKGTKAASKEDYEAYKGTLGLGRGGDTTTPGAQEAIKNQLLQEAAVTQLEANKKAEQLKAVMDEINKPSLPVPSTGTNEPIMQSVDGGAPEVLIPAEQPDKLTQMKTTGALQTAENVGGGIAGGVSGAAIGAAIGSIVPGPGTAVGAVVGGVIGFAGGVLGKMSLDERQNVENANALFKQGKSNIGTILTNLNKGYITPEQAQIQFQEQIDDINLALLHLHAENKHLNKFLSGGANEEIKARSWADMNIPILRQALAVGIMTPDPNKSYNFDEIGDINT
jgi:hypothetical protein